MVRDAFGTPGRGEKCHRSFGRDSYVRRISARARPQEILDVGVLAEEENVRRDDAVPVGNVGGGATGDGVSLGDDDVVDESFRPEIVEYADSEERPHGERAEEKEKASSEGT
jgi:hypothetical protein